MNHRFQTFAVLCSGLLVLWLGGCATFEQEVPAEQKVPAAEKDQPEEVLILEGDFAMTFWNEQSNQKSRQDVYVDAFYLDVHEVTNQGYAACVQAGECPPPLNTSEYDDPAYRDHPVVFVTREMAARYCRWQGERLPTRAEWEKAAAEELQAADYYWGDTSPVCQLGSRMGASVSQEADFEPDTEPVGSTPPNEYGLYEMTGGMWEWVSDGHQLEVYDSPPDTVSYLRIYRTGGYGPLYRRFLCSFRCAHAP